jgi:hypothetical protein
MERQIPRISPLKGEICEQYVKCGKENCRCANGRLHGPYYYRVFRDKGQVRKEYVRKKDLSQVRSAIAEYRQYDGELKKLRHRRIDLTELIREDMRGFDSMLA